MGIVCALASSFWVHSVLPVRASKARKRLSFVAPMKIRPPAVTTIEPVFGAPVFGKPFAANASTVPNGTRQTISPVFALTANSSAHGGLRQDQPLDGSQKRA